MVGLSAKIITWHQKKLKKCNPIMHANASMSRFIARTVDPLADYITML